jgi:hypothetical protein
MKIKLAFNLARKKMFLYLATCLDGKIHERKMQIQFVCLVLDLGWNVKDT